MRYINTNEDGSIGIWSVVPKTVTELSTGAVLSIFGVRRKTDTCVLYGTWSEKPENEYEIIVGDEAFDIADLEEDSIEGYKIEFPDFELEIKTKLHPDQRDKIVSHRVMKKDEQILDREFRGAWRDGGNKIDVDIPLAREITKERLRKQRTPKLEALDIEFIQAVEQNDKKKQKEIGNKKQKLRDITKHSAIDSATTPEELKSITIEEE